MKFIEFEGQYQSKWGLTDFYPDCEMKLMKAIASGEDFETPWLDCQKEIRSARYMREGDEFIISVSASMDDLWESCDLIYDALWAGCHTDKELPDDMIDRIRDIAIEEGLDDYTSYTKTLHGEVTFGQLVEETKSLEKEVEDNNADMFEELCEIVKNEVMGVLI